MSVIEITCLVCPPPTPHNKIQMLMEILDCVDLKVELQVFHLIVLQTHRWVSLSVCFAFGTNTGGANCVGGWQWIQLWMPMKVCTCMIFLALNIGCWHDQTKLFVLLKNIYNLAHFLYINHVYYQWCLKIYLLHLQ